MLRMIIIFTASLILDNNIFLCYLYCLFYFWIKIYSFRVNNYFYIKHLKKIKLNSQQYILIIYVLDLFLPLNKIFLENGLHNNISNFLFTSSQSKRLTISKPFLPSILHFVQQLDTLDIATQNPPNFHKQSFLFLYNQ